MLRTGKKETIETKSETAKVGDKGKSKGQSPIGIEKN
jgi:hypothetical protein